MILIRAAGLQPLSGGQRPGFGIASEENTPVVLQGASNIKNQSKILYSTVFYI
jgi:hypothetical protein